MRPEQDLVYLTSAVLRGMRRVLAAEKPDWVLVHGDTTTAMAAERTARSISSGHLLIHSLRRETK